MLGDKTLHTDRQCVSWMSLAAGHVVVRQLQQTPQQRAKLTASCRVARPAAAPLRRLVTCTATTKTIPLFPLSLVALPGGSGAWTFG